MKIVIVSFYNSFPPVSGAANVTYKFSKYLSGEKCLIQLSPNRSNKETDHGIKIINIKQVRFKGFRKIFEMFRNVFKIVSKIKKISPKCVVLEGASWALYNLVLISLLKRTKIDPLIVYHAHNVEYLLRKQKSHRLIANITKWAERNLLKKSDIITAVSENDANDFKELYGEKSLIVPNGVDIQCFDGVSDNQIKEIKAKYNLKGKLVLFMGLLAYLPNQEGIDFLINSVFPIVRKKSPDLKLVIIGGELKSKEKWILNPGVIPFEEIPILVKSCDVCVAPIFSGSGTRVKILEYMAAGKPVVSTTKGAEGLSVKNRDNIVIADDVENFAEEIVSLVTKPEYSKRIRIQGRMLVRKDYSWTGIMQSFNRVLEGHFLMND